MFGASGSSDSDSPELEMNHRGMNGGEEEGFRILFSVVPSGIYAAIK